MRKVGVVLGGVALAAAIASLAAQSVARSAGDAKRFVGTWRFVSDTSFGIIQYDASGYMSVQVASSRNRKPFAGPEPTLEEAREAIRTYNAYWGPYDVDERARTVTHHRLGHINPGMVGDFVRRYEFLPDGRLALEPVEPHSGDRRVWERIKPRE